MIKYWANIIFNVMHFEFSFELLICLIKKENSPYDPPINHLIGEEA